MYSIEERGRPNTEDYRLFICNNQGPISPLYDIPTYADADKKIVNMIVEIPRWTNAKMEIDMKADLNPLKQDVKNGRLRYVANCFPHHGYIWNYGAVPQTWEDPSVLDESTGLKGDNDPIDILEIGSRVGKRGEILQVKVLGALGLIDEGETDWKIFAISNSDPAADTLRAISDVDKHFPGLVKATIEWFKIYKVADGKMENQFAFNGEAKCREFAMDVIDQSHLFWQNLITKKNPSKYGISCVNVTIANSRYRITPKEAQEIMEKSRPPGPAAPIDPAVSAWWYYAYEIRRKKF